MTTSLKAIALIIVLALPSAAAAAGNEPAVSPAPAPAATTPAHQAPEKGERKEITGTVLQTMNSGGYSYVYLDTKEQKVWVAVPQTKVRTGDVMTVKGGMEMPNFQSTTLNRTFDTIIFSEGVVSASGSKDQQSPGASGAVVTGDTSAKVAKASAKDGYTVSELYAKSAKLHKKKVSVRGKVVKVSSNIMGKNWIHLQDGSGSQKKGTNNLVVTSKVAPTVGDVVTARGVLFKDKDFGSNYKYKVIVEDATLTP